MRRIFLTAIALSAFTTAAIAADMPMKGAPYAAPSPMPSWTGFYVGVEGGWGWGEAQRGLLDGSFQNTYDTDGGIAGGLLGYNWQAGQSVVGVEGRWAWADVKGDDNGVGGTVDHTKLRSIGSVVGRLGWAPGNVLYFFNAGWAFADARHTNDGPPLQHFSRDLDSGWTIGVGAEWLFAPNWTFRVDYRYYDFGDYWVKNGVGLSPFKVDNTLNTVTAGVSYKW